MARPRVFLSSTYYDLRHLRGELELFIREMGFEPILNERGHIPYGSTQRLEDECYDEVERGDMLVSIVGGRYGSNSAREPHSISQVELKTALKKGKQVYIFIEKGVHAEYGTWGANKGSDGKVDGSIKWRHVDNSKIFEFLDEVMALPNNNQYASFEIGRDITTYLKEQWAGLFQRFLREAEGRREVELVSKLESASNTLNDLVRYVTEQSKMAAGGAVQELLRFHHPLFTRIRQLHGVQYPTFVFSKNDLDERLTAWGFKFHEDHSLDTESEWWEYVRPVQGKRPAKRVMAHKDLFDKQGNLSVIQPDAWNDEMYQLEDYSGADDDIPF